MRSLKLAVFGLVLLAMFLFACGKGGNKLNLQKTGPIAPGSDLPSPGYDDSFLLDVIRDTSGAPQGVRLTFDTSPQSSIVGYNFYKSVTSFTDATEASKINPIPEPHVPQPSMVYNDIFTVEIGQEYFYRFSVVDAEGDESPLSSLRSIVITPHSITDVQPGTAAVGDGISITGTFFGANYNPSTDRVYFWGLLESGASASSLRSPSAVLETGFIEAQVISWSDTLIETQVPDTTINGPVKVSIDGMDAQWNGPFVCTTPYIWNASPDPVVEGELMFIQGGNFNLTQGLSNVFIGGQIATPLVWGNSSIQVSVPYGWGTKDVYVDVDGVGITNVVSIVVEPTSVPVITDVTDQRAARGDRISILGTNFGALTGVLDFNGLVIDEDSPELVSWTTSEIVIDVTSAANTTGLIQVHNFDGVPSNEWFFRIGASRDAVFANANMITAGKMYGHGSALCLSGGYLHMFTISENNGSLHYFRREIGTDFNEEIEIPGVAAFEGNIEGTAAALTTQAGFVVLAFGAAGRVYTVESDDDGLSWTDPVEISATLPAGEIGSIAVWPTRQDSPAVAWGDSATGSVYAYYWDGDSTSGVWKLREIFPDGFGTGEIKILRYDDATMDQYVIAMSSFAASEIRVRETAPMSDGLSEFPAISPAMSDFGMYRAAGSAQFYIYFWDTALKIAFHNGADPDWSFDTISGTDEIGRGIDGLYDPGTDSSIIVTARFQPPHHPYLYIFSHDSGNATSWSIIDDSNSEALSPAVVLDKTNVYSIVGDTESYDLWYIDWLSSSAPYQESVTDGFGSFFLPKGSDIIASDESGGAGFLMVEKRRNPTGGFNHALYAGYFQGGVFVMSPVIDTGGSEDFLCAGVEAIGNTFHIVFQKGQNVYYTTWVGGFGTIPTPTSIASLGTGAFDDIAILAGHTNLLNVLYLFETDPAGPYTLRLAKLPDVGGTWSIEDVTDIDISPFGLDLTIDPDGEFLIPVFYDVVFGRLYYARQIDTVWMLEYASLSALAGLNPIAEYHHPTGFYVQGFNSPQNRIEMITGGPPWVQEVIGPNAQYITPFDMSGGSFDGSWRATTVFLNRLTNELRFGVRNPGDSTTTVTPITSREPLWTIGHIGSTHDTEGGVTAVYSSEQDPGIYLLRFDGGGRVT